MRRLDRPFDASWLHEGRMRHIRQRLKYLRELRRNVKYNGLEPSRLDHEIDSLKVSLEQERASFKAEQEAK